MKKIVIIFTGGTISMKKDEKSNAAIPTMSGEDILKLTPGMEYVADIQLLDFGMMPGPHITPENMQELSIFHRKW